MFFQLQILSTQFLNPGYDPDDSDDNSDNNDNDMNSNLFDIKHHQVSLHCRQPVLGIPLVNVLDVTQVEHEWVKLDFV